MAALARWNAIPSALHAHAHLQQGLGPRGAAVSPAAGTGYAQGHIAVPDGPDQPILGPANTGSLTTQTAFSALGWLGHLHVRIAAHLNLLPSTLPASPCWTLIFSSLWSWATSKINT